MSWKTRGGAKSRTTPARAPAPKPKQTPAPAPIPSTEPPSPAETWDLNELLDARGIAKVTKADLLMLAEEFAIDISGAQNNSERMGILADHEYPIDDEK